MLDQLTTVKDDVKQLQDAIVTIASSTSAIET